MLFKYQLFTIVSLLFIFSISACSDNSTGISEDPEATINGSVEGETSQAKINSANKSTEGIVVTVARVTSNGSIETISGTETETNASGEFSINVDANAANHFIVIAEHSSGELMGFVSAEIENNQSYTLKPINIESTAETSIFTEVVANNNSDIVQKSDIETIIRSGAAAQIYGNSSAAAEIAAGMANYAEARAEIFTEFVEGNVQSNLDQFFALMADAQFEYEANINAASSAGQKETAFETFLETQLDAYAEIGAEVSTASKLLHMQSKALQNSITSVSSEIKNEVRSSTSIFAAMAVDIAAQANAEASGMSEATISAIVDAGTNLKNDIKASDGASAEITAVFETYREEVSEAMENDSSVEATVIVTIDTEINSSGGAKFIFDNAVSGVVDVNLLGDIYLTFVNNVHSNVESKSEELGEVNTESVAKLLLLINLFS